MKVFNDSKEIGVVLYLTGLLLATVILITLVFRSYLNVYTGTYAVGICLIGAVIIGVVFISKVSLIARKLIDIYTLQTPSGNSSVQGPKWIENFCNYS